MSIKEKQDRLPTLYWLPKLHKRPYKARFIANSISCTTTVLSKLLTSCLTPVKKNHWIRYYDTVYERDGINYFWSIKNSNDDLYKFKSKNFQASKLSTYDFSTLYTTLPHHRIKDKLIDLINRTLIRRIPNIWLATKNVLFSFAVNTIITIYGRVKKSVMPLFIFWIIFLLDLQLNFIGKLLVFRWELIVLLLLQICFFFCVCVMRGVSWVSLTSKSGWHYWGFQFNFKIPWWFIKYW